MPLLPGAAALTRARTEAERTLPDTVELWRPTLTDDESGGSTTTWNRIDRYAARVIARSTVPTERPMGERVTAVTSWQVRLPWDADPAPGDRILRATTTSSTMTEAEMKVHADAGRTLEVTDADEIKSTPTSVLVNGYRVT